MGFGRDLGAAVTFGLSATTKHKQAEAQLEQRQRHHQNKVGQFKVLQDSVTAAEAKMDEAFAKAQQALLDSGAVTIQDGQIVYGWYRPQEAGQADYTDNKTQSLIGSIPAFGIGIGTPAAIWTLVGIYGTAATGTAIGALSGAAAGAATAAWIGRAATLGLGGMTAGRFALGPIGAIASLATLPIGAAIAGSKERKFIDAANDAKRQMDKYESILDTTSRKLRQVQPRIDPTTETIRQSTTLLTKAEQQAGKEAAAHQLNTAMQQAAALKNQLHVIAQEFNQDMLAGGF